MNRNGLKIGIILIGMLLIGLPAQADDTAQVGYDSGFYFKTHDGKFKLKVNGLFQGRYFFATSEDDPNTTDVIEDKFQHSFRIRKSRVSFDQHFGEKVKYNLTVNYGTSSKGSKNFLAVTNLAYTVSPELKITVGMVGLPFSHGESYLMEDPITGTQEDDTNLTLTRKAFGLPYDLGATFSGSLGLFSYAVGIGNGEGAWSYNANNEFSYGVRMAVDAVKNDNFNMTIGVGGGWEEEDAQERLNPDDETTAQFTWDRRLSAQADLTISAGPFSTAMAAFYRRSSYKGGTTLDDTNRDGKLIDLGYYTDVGFFVVPDKLQLVGRVGQMLREGADNNAFEFGGGVHYDINKTLRWSTDYTFVLDYDDIPGLNNKGIHKIRTQLQAKF